MYSYAQLLWCMKNIPIFKHIYFGSFTLLFPHTSFFIFFCHIRCSIMNVMWMCSCCSDCYAIEKTFFIISRYFYSSTTSIHLKTWKKSGTTTGFACKCSTYYCWFFKTIENISNLLAHLKHLHRFVHMLLIT